jgi:putative ABC transport system permease protein
MIGHLFKLVWNRRRSNALILIELVISFIGLSWGLTMACLFLDHWRRPLGFEYERVWRLDTGLPHFLDLDEGDREQAWATMDQVRLFLEQTEEIEAFSPMAHNVPLGNSAGGYHNFLAGREQFIRDNAVTPAALEVLGLQLVAGRWFEEGDSALAWKPVVLTRDYADLLFGDEDPIGQTVLQYDRNGETSEGDEPLRVIGLIQPLRRRGELTECLPEQFSLVEWGLPAWPPSHFVLKVREGVPAVFQDELAQELGRLAPGWRPEVVPLSRFRARLLRDAVMPLLVLGAIAFFLIVMVGLGLVGVLWQAVTRRTEEIGLRRALGASAGEIRTLVLGELVALTSVAAGAGIFVHLHLALLQAFPAPSIPPGIHIQALTLALLVVYSFVLVCGLYPAWLATRVKPAQALQYE